MNTNVKEAIEQLAKNITTVEDNFNNRGIYPQSEVVKDCVKSLKVSFANSMLELLQDDEVEEERCINAGNQKCNHHLNLGEVRMSVTPPKPSSKVEKLKELQQRLHDHDGEMHVTLSDLGRDLDRLIDILLEDEES